MAVLTLTGATTLIGTAWTGTAPGGATTPSGTITSTTDVSQWVQAVGWEEAIATKETTNMASAAFVTNTTGLKSGQVTFSFLQDFAASAIDQVFYSSPLSGLGSLFYVDIKPTSSARSATNPSRVAQLILSEFKPVTAQVGELIVVQVSLPMTGAFARLTS